MKKIFKSAILSLIVMGMFLSNIGLALAANDCGNTADTADHYCMNTVDAIPGSCIAGHCPGDNTIQCCKTKTASEGIMKEVDTNSLNGFMQLALNITKWILGLSGSASLLMFVYGGVMFLISAGSGEKVSQAKGIIVGSVIGLLIVFSSYVIIGFIIGDVMGIEKAKNGGWASSNWFK